MEYGKNYTLVSAEHFNKHVPSPQQLSDLDEEMRHIIMSSLSQDQKLKEYYNLLQKKMNIEKFNSPFAKTTPEEEIENEDNLSGSKTSAAVSVLDDLFIINSVPSKMKDQARNLLQLIKSHPKNILSWNDAGEISLHNKHMSHTNIGDLFHALFSHNKRRYVNGQNEFIKVLYDLNIPQHYIKNKYMTVKTEESAVKMEEEPPVVKKSHVFKNKTPVKWESYK